MSGTTCEGTEFEVTSSNWLHKCTSVWGSKFAYIFCLNTRSDYKELEGGSWQQVPTSRKRSEYLWKHWLVIRPVVRAISCDMRKRQRSQCRLIRRLSHIILFEALCDVWDPFSLELHFKKSIDFWRVSLRTPDIGNVDCTKSYYQVFKWNELFSFNCPPRYSFVDC